MDNENVLQNLELGINSNEFFRGEIEVTTFIYNDVLASIIIMAVIIGISFLYFKHDKKSLTILSALSLYYIIFYNLIVSWTVLDYSFYTSTITNGIFLELLGFLYHSSITVILLLPIVMYFKKVYLKINYKLISNIFIIQGLLFLLYQYINIEYNQGGIDGFYIDSGYKNIYIFIGMTFILTLIESIILFKFIFMKEKNKIKNPD